MDHSLVAIVLANDGQNRFVADVKERGFRFDGENFQCRDIASNWIGFYDWLRTDSGEVIGVRLAIDTPDIFSPKMLKILKDASQVITGSIFYIYFNKERNFCESLSDDTDFGGNFVCEGNSESMGITFNEPTVRK